MGSEHCDRANRATPLPRPRAWWLACSVLGLAPSGACDGVRAADRPPAVADAAPPPARLLPLGDAEGGQEDASLIPRSAFFAAPDRAEPAVSPDGETLGFIAPIEGVPNLWIRPIKDAAASRPVTHYRRWGIRGFRFAYDGAHVLYWRDADGDEKWRVHALNLSTGQSRDLSLGEGTQSRLIDLSPSARGAALISISDRDQHTQALYRVDLATGVHAPVDADAKGFTQVYASLRRGVRLGQRPVESGGFELLRRAEERWSRLAVVPHEDALSTEVLSLTADGSRAVALDSRGRADSALVEIDLTIGRVQAVGEGDRVDGANVIVHPATGRVQAYAVGVEGEAWRVVDPEVAPDFNFLRALGEGRIGVESRSLDERLWVVSLSSPDLPKRFYLYRRARGAREIAPSATPLFAERERVADGAGTTRSVSIRSRDGHELVSYLTLPRAVAAESHRPVRPIPVVIVVHDGPWKRDFNRYDAVAHWLASRGYGALRVNFRGSTGFGKSFVSAADLQWGRAMQDDLVDARDWLLRERVAMAGKIAIYGAGYGGYAALAALAMTPSAFACAVDIGGPSNLVTHFAGLSRSSQSLMGVFARRVGDPRTDEGRALLLERSPLTHVGQIGRPLLVVHGVNDPAVDCAESDQLVAAMQRRSLPVAYARVADEGRLPWRGDNAVALAAIAEAFLSRCLGGPYEPLREDIQRSSLKVPAGAETIPGLLRAFGG